ncbi:MAG: hypothetical protein Q9182_003046 [Xanthomendoza sp. 2 TL-2023]
MPIKIRQSNTCSAGYHTNPGEKSTLSSASTGITTSSSKTETPAGTSIITQPASTEISSSIQQEASTSESSTTSKPSVANDTSNGNSSSGPARKIPIIVGVAGGVVAAAIAMWLIWRNGNTGFRDMVGRKQIRGLESMEITPHTKSQPSPGLLTEHGGDGYYSASLGPSELTNDKRAPSQTNSSEVIGARNKQIPYSPQSILFSTKEEESVPSSPLLPNSGGFLPSPTVRSELSAEPSPKPELSPNPEKLEINKWQQQSGQWNMDPPTTDSHLSPRDIPEASAMRANLEVSDEGDRRRFSHVMSWMSY